jgi:hypothetical protein
MRSGGATDSTLDIRQLCWLSSNSVCPERYAVGGTPAAAVGTTALAKKPMIGAEKGRFSCVPQKGVAVALFKSRLVWDDGGVRKSSKFKVQSLRPSQTRANPVQPNQTKSNLRPSLKLRRDKSAGQAKCAECVMVVQLMSLFGYFLGLGRITPDQAESNQIKPAGGVEEVQPAFARLRRGKSSRFKVQS